MRELFKPSKDAESLVISILKIEKFWIWIFCGWLHNWDNFKGFEWRHRALDPNLNNNFFVSFL